jgi:hypothetical protein
VEGAVQTSGQSAMEDLHRTAVKSLVVLFHAVTVKEGFKSWVVGKKVFSFRSKSACKSDPGLLVRRVFFPTTELATPLGRILFRISGFI